MVLLNVCRYYWTQLESVVPYVFLTELTINDEFNQYIRVT